MEKLIPRCACQKWAIDRGKVDECSSGVCWRCLSTRAGPAPISERSAELLELDEALTRLEQMDVRKAKVIELRFFGGLSVEEAAEVLKVSPPTVMRDWRLARVWLARELRG